MKNDAPQDVIKETARRFPGTVCPTCKRAVALADLDYRQDHQETECPNGHPVTRTFTHRTQRWSGWTAR